MVAIDGSVGEGGGQVLRSALTLSMMTGQALEIFNIRAKRSTPGLRPQHLQSVQAAQKVSQAQVEGIKIGSTRLTFKPGALKAGRYHFDIGTAGSTSLVLQTILLPLTWAARNSSVTITGGTHVPWSPCFHYLDWQWIPYLQQMGIKADLVLELAGFYPQGGGRIQAKIQSSRTIRPLTLLERGHLRQVRGISATANLPREIAKRQRQRVVSQLGSRYPLNDIRIVQFPSRFKGTMILLMADFESGQACYFGLGAPGKRAEVVADDAIQAMAAFLETKGVIDQYLADQLLLPMAFADGSSIFRTSKVTQHLLTNAEIIREFLPVTIQVAGQLGMPGMVEVNPQ